MNIHNIEDGAIIELPIGSNVTAKAMKDEIVKLHPNKSFVVISANTVASHTPKTVDDIMPQTVAAYTAMLSKMGIEYIVGEYVKNGNPAKMADVQQITIGESQIMLNVDPSMQTIVSIETTAGALNRLNPQTTDEAVYVQQCKFTKCYIKDDGSIGCWPSFVEDFTFIHPLTSGGIDFCGNWAEVANGKRASLTLQMAVVDGDIKIATTDVIFDKGTYVETFILHDPDKCRNSVRAQFDNISMHMLGE